MKELRLVLRGYPFERVAHMAGVPQGQGKCLCGNVVRSVREKERDFGGGTNHCSTWGWTKGASPGARTWLCYSSESETRQTWFTKDEDFTTGIQGARRTHSFENPTACRTAAACTQRTIRISARFWKQQLHLSIIFPQNWLCLWRKATENKQAIQFVILKTHFLSASSFACFPSSFLSVLLSRGHCSEHCVGFWHQRRNWLRQNEAWCTQKEEKEQQVDELVTYSALPFVSCDSRLHQCLMWLLRRTVSLHSCFGWSCSFEGSEMLSTRFKLQLIHFDTPFSWIHRQYDCSEVSINQRQVSLGDTHQAMPGSPGCCNTAHSNQAEISSLFLGKGWTNKAISSILRRTASEKTSSVFLWTEQHQNCSYTKVKIEFVAWRDCYCISVSINVPR